MISFASDYLEGCHPSILERLLQTNLEQTPGYGEDAYCETAREDIRKTFACPDSAVHFLVGGTQANTTVIASVLRPYEGVLCAVTGHINVHETGAIESSGHKCLALPAADGRITAQQVREAVALQGNDEHVVKPGMVYISQSTEVGTLYTKAMLQELYATCKELGLPLFIDGARLGYAMASPENDLLPADLPQLCDVFTLGGTKVGALFGEAVIINNPALNRDFRYMIKQRGGMLAKGRLLGLQFSALMADGLYFRLGQHAVDLAMALRDCLLEKRIPLFADAPTNTLFVTFTDEQVKVLTKEFDLSFWEKVDDTHTAMRICTSWATPKENVEKLMAAIRAL